MKRSEYLYGVPGCHFEQMTYREVLIEKIARAKELRFELVRVRNQPYTKRVDDITEAIEFNEKMLRDLDGDL